MAPSEPPSHDTARLVQPMPAPLYLSEYRQLLAEGRLVDRAGRPVSGQPCPTCDGRVDTYTCPRAVPCPSCHARTGQRCRRASGHTADRWHKERIRAAEALDDGRERARDTSLLAPWPPSHDIA
jgi:hypothetical protein